MNSAQKRTIGKVGIILSVILFLMKAYAGFLSGSVAIISDALSAFLDILTYSVVYFSIRVQDQRADARHPFGHRRAEPLASLFIASIAGLLGASILRDAVVSLLQPTPREIHSLATLLIVTTIVIKVMMAVAYRQAYRRSQSPAMHSAFVDSGNDILASSGALIGFTFGRPFDELAAFLIGVWVIVSGVRIGLQNIGYLMGESPPKHILKQIRSHALAIPGVIGLNDLRAHYIGDRIHVELHIEIDKNATLQSAHDIGVVVKRRIENMDIVQDAFIHIDPV